ncbi:MAG TPA: hypothetical protein VM513_30720 [Kofleriaceae bacterium]|nr:hypothetical protein [Kofleriaceae bacterium]
MQIGSSVLVAALALAACSNSKPATKGRIVVAITVDWEGAYLSPEGLDALDEVREALGPKVPVTHFVCAAYFTKTNPDPAVVKTLTQSVRSGDELAVHLHGWKSLAVASAIEPRLSPSFLTGTDKLLEFADGDVGFDTDLDAYSGPELRTLLRTSRRLLEAQTKLPVSKAFRAGGYLGTPKVLQAIHDEGYTVDSSATDARQLDERKDDVLPRRVTEIWPKVDSGTQPFYVPQRGGQLLELPIAAFADYATAAEITGVIEAAGKRLAAAPNKDVFVVLGFHQETADEFGPRLRDGVAAAQQQPALASKLLFTTIDHAAALARPTATPAPTGG